MICKLCTMFTCATTFQRGVEWSRHASADAGTRSCEAGSVLHDLVPAACLQHCTKACAVPCQHASKQMLPSVGTVGVSRPCTAVLGISRRQHALSATSLPGDSLSKLCMRIVFSAPTTAIAFPYSYRCLSFIINPYTYSTFQRPRKRITTIPCFDSSILQTQSKPTLTHELPLQKCQPLTNGAQTAATAKPLRLQASCSTRLGRTCCSRPSNTSQVR